MSKKVIVFPLTGKKAPAVPKGTDWREFEGDVNSALYGVGVPDGVIVFDLDLYKGVTREDVEDAFGCVLPWDDALLQGTLSGGEHYAFAVPVGCDLINGTRVLGVDGFDTRSAGKGYIATGEGYTDHTLFGVVDTLHSEDYLPALPERALQLLRIDYERDDDDFMALVGAQPLDVSIDEIDLYLSKLTSEHAKDSDTWLGVMMGIYHQFGGSEEGWRRVDAFSQLSPSNYDHTENRKRWESLGKSKRDNPKTFASIIKLVGGRDVVVEQKALGLRERVAACEDKDQLQELVKEIARVKLDDINALLIKKDLAAAFKSVTGTAATVAQIDKMINRARSFEKRRGDYVEDYVFLTATGEYMCRKNKTTMGPRAFDVALGRETPRDSDGNEVPATFYVRDKIDVVHIGMYAPHISKTGSDIFEYDGIKYVNTYVPCSLERVPAGTTDIVERVKRHVEHIIADAREQQIFIDYLAHNVQNTGEKKHWAILLQGVPGDGKSFFAEMMKHVLGNRNSISITAEALEEKFTPWAEGHALVCIEEIKLDNVQKHEVLNKIKPYITNPVVSVRRMRTDVYEAVNTTNYLIFTNYKDALPIDDNDRRYAIIFSRWQDKVSLERWMGENPNYYPNLYADMRENAGELLDWLLTHPISDEFKAMTRAPDTLAKRSMIEATRSSVALLVEDAIVEHECWDINEQVVNITKLARLATDCFASDQQAAREFPKTSRLRNIMEELGYHAIGRYKDKDRKNQVIYAKNPNAKPTDFAHEDPDFIPF